MPDLTPDEQAEWAAAVLSGELRPREDGRVYVHHHDGRFVTYYDPQYDAMAHEPFRLTVLRYLRWRRTVDKHTTP